MTVRKVQRVFSVICVMTLVLSTLPLYAIAFNNHPYYDDYGFSATVHHAWKESGSLQEVFSAAWESAEHTRQYWQGNYTGTLLSNLQPGLFSEELYWIGNWFILTSLVVCGIYFFCTAFKRMGMAKWARISLSSLAVMLMVQFMPDVGEAFYWFNGGIGNTFIYAMLMLAAAWCIRLYDCKGSGLGWSLLIALMAVVLGGGSYGGGLFALCTGAAGLLWMYAAKKQKRLQFTVVYLLFAGCFLYSMVAPGNAVRASYIQYEGSVVKTVLQSFYFGIGQMGKFVRLPLIAVTLVFLPAILEAAQKSTFGFKHPVFVLAAGVCLYCTQFAPPLYSIASIGAGRIVNAYYISFVVLWFLAVYYLAGYAVRKMQVPQLSLRQFGALLLTGICLFGTGCLAFRHSGDVLYGAQNMAGPSALLSIITGEAAQYDREMSAREVFLNDESQPVITLEPLSAVPQLFMDDLIIPNAVYDVREAMCLYYGKQEIHIAGEEELQ